MSCTKIHLSSEEPLFRAVMHFKNSSKHKLKKSNSPISSSSARQNMLLVIEKTGIIFTNFRQQSLRSDGTIVAANNGVKNWLLKRQGRRKSEEAKDGYVKNYLCQLLPISEIFGLYITEPLLDSLNSVYNETPLLSKSA